jgi:ubiquitin-protein ligase
MAVRVISKPTIQRLVKDIKFLKKNSLESHGIFYEHDENDMMTGRALIIGPQNTPYFGGNYFFKLQFPDDYPFRPPWVTFCTNGDRIRMNPNLYVNGKVCISILNTWRGEQWSSCQSISSVLLALQTLFVADPFSNEPGITRSHREFENYTKIIEYKNIDLAVLKMVTKTEPYYMNEFDCFDHQVKEMFLKNASALKEFIKEKEREVQWLSHSFYSMHCEIDYKSLLIRFPSDIAMETEI